MRLGREHRGDQDRIGPGADARLNLARMMCRPCPQSAQAVQAPAMNTLLPSPEPSLSRADQHQPSPPRDSRHPRKDRPPLIDRQRIVPKNDAGPRRQPLEHFPKRLPHPFVGHQPVIGNAWVASGHRHPYSTRMTEHDPAKALHDINQAIARAAILSGRKPGDVCLIAVSKTQPADAIEPLIDAGHRVFGENRVQEAEAKWPGLLADHPDILLHLIGQLQSNKAEAAVALFDVIHSVDRSSLVTALARAMDRTDKRPDCFIQVNIGDEPQKGGVPTAALAALIAEARTAQLPVIGLMAIPPADVEPAPYFALLAKLARDHGMETLSMGMSSDFETAVTLGATHVRVGSALFGARA